MSEMKNAVVVGKVELKPRHEIVVSQKQRPSRGSKPSERQERKRDDRFKAASNTAMLQELQYVKKQLRAAKDNVTTLSVSGLLFEADVRALVAALETAPTRLDHDGIGHVAVLSDLAEAALYAVKTHLK